MFTGEGGYVKTYRKSVDTPRMNIRIDSYQWHEKCISLLFLIIQIKEKMFFATIQTIGKHFITYLVLKNTNTIFKNRKSNSLIFSHLLFVAHTL